MLSTRGRLALLLADMPGKWQDQFLRPGPWPEEFVERHAQDLSAGRAGFSTLQNGPAPAASRARSPRWPTSAACRSARWWPSGSLFVLILIGFFVFTHHALTNEHRHRRDRHPERGDHPPPLAVMPLPPRPRAAGLPVLFLGAAADRAWFPCCLRTCSGAPAGPLRARCCWFCSSAVFLHRHRLHARRLRFCPAADWATRSRITRLGDYAIPKHRGHQHRHRLSRFTTRTSCACTKACASPMNRWNEPASLSGSIFSS